MTEYILQNPPLEISILAFCLQLVRLFDLVLLPLIIFFFLLSSMFFPLPHET